MRVIAIVQARLGSTRLPNKVLKKINGKSLIEILLLRLSEAKEIDDIIVATPTSTINDILVSHVKALGFKCYQGSENNVLKRYVEAAQKYNADVVVRITGDCPLVDPKIVDLCINIFKKNRFDYVSNTLEPTFPDGLDVEVVSINALEQALEETTNSEDLEHVTPYVKKSNKFLTNNVSNTDDFSELRWTVDEQFDLDVITNVFDYYKPNISFSWKSILQLYSKKPELFFVNKFIKRNEGAEMGKGQKLWKRAKHIIPGGSMLLSKRSEMFLPEQWPSYFNQSKGCKVWDLDGKEYIDMSIMGIGTNSLGYGHPEVDQAVSKTIRLGNMSTLNCPEEVFLSEKLIELHPWAEMVRLARSGGEANAIAVRIARAASGKDKVAFCGYHGWHDWYLSVNLSSSKNLEGHLLPGLNPSGVPKSLDNTTFSFTYNNISELEELINQHDIGVIKMEVSRNEPPLPGYLEKVRELTYRNGIVLIFDECTSGFREAYGGLHKKYGVNPDMAMFGKALGNGYAITAIIGTRDVMEAAQSTFISSTFWTERIGPSAAIKTLEVMKQLESWKVITQKGKRIKKSWQKLADKYGISISHWGIPALAGFSFNNKNALAYKTLVTQEMLAKGYLASNSVYVCIDHTEEIIDGYFAALEEVFSIIQKCENGLDVSTLLNGPVCHEGFKRLN